MPVGDFPGRHNWGYDGVSIYAPARCYGTPDALRTLVDRAHQHGLAVVLDVVYNHFGPDGAYAVAFSPYFLSNSHESPWGRGLNFDGPYSAEVRRFFIDNALQWVRDYHVDALRLDATHAIVDDSTPHFLAELSSTVRSRTGRHVPLIAEDHRNLARMMVPVDAGGYGLDAVWADDFHHQVRVHTAGDREGYYADYGGSTRDLARTLQHGWFFTGQGTPRTGRPRGTDPSGLTPPRFVLCLQNHDQVGNRFDGARLNHQIDPAAYRALAVLLLTLPHTPLLFMGQEWAASSPFLFFTDHYDALGHEVTRGRRAEFAAFTRFGDPEAVPDPQREETVARSRLAWDEIAREPHAGVLRLYRRLLELRRVHPALLASGRESFSVQEVDEHTVRVQRWSSDRADSLVAIVRMSGAGPTRATAPPEVSQVLLTTEDAEFAPDPSPIHADDDPVVVEFGRPGAILLETRQK
jgi:maltooligosyltrehalose trehalohydrolase